MKPVVKVVHGPNGWGGPFTLTETETQTVVASITGGGIHPIAERIAELLGVPAVDGFKNKVEPENMIVAVVDCGGTARCGVYPKYGVKTIDVIPIGPSGPLAKFINEENFCSGVLVEEIQLIEGDEAITAAVEADVESAILASEPSASAKFAAEGSKVSKEAAQEEEEEKQGGFVGLIAGMGKAVGGVVNTFYQAARDSLDIIIRNIIPFMMFISVIVGIINYTGIGNILANVIKPLAGSLPGLLVLSIICSLPFLSPVLGPGAVIAQIIGVLLGNEIGKGTIPTQYALPALFAINAQVGCDFLPVALTLAEAEDATTNIGVPAILFSRLITGPITVIIAYLFSFGM